MSGYLLDTPLVTAYLRGRPATVARISPWLNAHEAGTSIIVYGEGIEYLRGFSDPGRWQISLRAVLRQLRVYDLTYAILERYADLRRSMRPPHGPGLIGDMDTLIAATALVHHLTVVTLDSDYTRV
ncbi:MAG: type II toxin-antitoxin system VapC family toxin, partial [Ktedonobacterales bacterium]